MSESRNDWPLRLLIAAGALLGLLAVVGGTFAAHVLDKNLDPKMINTFETGVRYHMYDALAALASAWVYTRWPSRLSLLAGWLFVIGAVLFSGALYLLVGTGAKWLGAVAPIGGSSMLVGWLLLMLAVLIPNHSESN